MLHYQTPEGTILIGQPAHAWVSGQLARAWGNDRFGAVEPWEEVCLGSEQHDFAWAPWELNPTLNAATGRPHNFFELPVEPQIELWSDATRQWRSLSRYAAVLVSMHRTGLYDRFASHFEKGPSADAMRAHVQSERDFQAETIETLRADARYGRYATAECLERNRKLIWTWDGFSLALFAGPRGEGSLKEVPTADGEVTLKVIPSKDEADAVTIDPWPFKSDRVDIICEGRRLDETFDDEAAMREAYATAPWVTLGVQLQPQR